MRKSALLFALLLLNIPFDVKADVNLVELVKKIQPAVATVITYNKDKKLLGSGSGFFLDKNGHLITNYHVLKGAYSAEVRTFDGKEYPVKLVVAESEDFDLVKVLVDVPRKDVKFVKVSMSVPSVAERVVVVGSPMGLEHTVSEGIVSAVRDIPDIGKILQISAPISQGSSGSPVVNMKGDVIGVATFQFIEGQNLNFAVTGEKILSLKSEKKGKTLAVWASGISEKKREVAKSLYNVGIKFLWTGEYEKALDNFKKAVEENNRFAEAWFQAGYCSGELGRYSKAIEAYKQAIRIKPDYAKAHNNMGTAYGKLGRNLEAIEILKQAIRIKPDNAVAHYNMGTDYGELGRYSKAIEA